MRKVKSVFITILLGVVSACVLCACSGGNDAPASASSSPAQATDTASSGETTDANADTGVSHEEYFDALLDGQVPLTGFQLSFSDPEQNDPPAGDSLPERLLRNASFTLMMKSEKPTDASSASPLGMVKTIYCPSVR